MPKEKIIKQPSEEEIQKILAEPLNLEYRPEPVKKPETIKKPEFSHEQLVFEKAEPPELHSSKEIDRVLKEIDSLFPKT